MSGEPQTRGPERGIARDVALNVAARVITVVASGVTAILVAANLTRSEYGAYSIAVGIALLLVVGTDMGMASSLGRFLAQRHVSRALLVRAQVWRHSLAAAATGVLCLVLLVAGDELGRVGALLPAAGALLFAQSIVALLNSTLPALRLVRVLALITVTTAVLELIFVALLTRGDVTGAHILLASTTAMALSGLTGLALQWRGMGEPEDPAAVPALRDVRRYGLTVFGVTITMTMFGQLDPLVIGAFHGAATVAPYALALKCMAFLTGPATAIGSIVAPRVARGRGQDRDTLDTWTMAMFVLFLGPVTVLATLSDELFAAINPAYADDGMLLTALCPFFLAVCVATLPTMAITMLGEAKARVRVAVITLIINVALDLALIPWLEAWGAVIGTSVAFSFYFAGHMRIVRANLPDLDRAIAAQLASACGLALVAAGGVAVLSRVLANAMGGTDEAIAALAVGGGVSGTLYLAVAAGVWRRFGPREAVDG